MIPKIVKRVTLVAPTSPKRAFYNITLTCDGYEAYEVTKESGVSVQTIKVCDRRSWPFGGDAENATKFFDRKVSAKLKPGREGRRYEFSLPGFV